MASIYERRSGTRHSCMVESSELCVYSLYDTRVADMNKQCLSKCCLDQSGVGYLG